MLTEQDHEAVAEVLPLIEEGCADGWHRPVVLNLLSEEGPAAAVLAALRKALPMAEGPRFLLPALNTAELLRDCCGPGGAFVGALLLDDNELVQRNVEIEVLQVVLARTAHEDGITGGVSHSFTVKNWQ